MGSKIYSKELIQETIWTINLLFPRNDKETRKFLTRHKRDFNNDPPYVERRPLNLNDYVFWRDRLSELRQIYAAQPRNLRAALMDNRSTLQLYTLWTAVIIFLLTVVFGVISSVTAIISTRATLRALNIAAQALQLQIKQNAQAQQ